MNDLLSEKSVIRKYQQTLLGIVFLAVTPLSVLPGFLFFSSNPEGWWHSISQTYCSNTSIIMISLFMIGGIISITYRARNIIEKILMFLFGIGDIGILFFPHALTDAGTYGFFELEGSLCTSLHFIFAGICFCSMCAAALLFAFIPEETENKHKRNVLYISSWAIIGLCGIFIALTKRGVLPPWTVLMMEFIMFSLFSVDLLCSAGKISFLR